MSNLFGSTPKVIPEFTGLQVNTAVQVLPIPIIYGAPRISINLIYYNGFNVQEKSSSGKGILSGGKGSKTVEYFATIALAIGEGPMGATMIIYQDSDVYIPSDYPTNGAYYFNGSDTQSPWSYVQSRWPSDARSYKDTAYYGFSNAQLDSSATVPQIDLVVKGLYNGSSPLNNSTITITSGQYDNQGNPQSYIGPINIGSSDADPAYVIYDFLTNVRYGATFPAEWIDGSSLFTSASGLIPTVGDAALSTYCQAVGLAWSVAINNVESASSILERWCKNLNVAVVWTGEILKFIPYWDTYSGDNPGWDSTNGVPQKYYQPYITSVATLTMDDILQSSSKDEDPISFSRKDPLEVYNTVRVDYKDRFNFFNDVPAEAKDEAHIELYGPRIDNIGLANEFSYSGYAETSATMQLRRNIGIMRTFVWKMGPLWAWFNPMDIILIPDPVNYNSLIAVRIVSLEDDEDENTTITAEEFLPNAGITLVESIGARTGSSGSSVGAQSPTILPISQTTPPYQGALNNPTFPVYPPVIFEPTTSMLTALGFATPQFIFGCSGGTGGTLDPNWGGCNVWISLDAVNYELIGTLIRPADVGYITSPLPGYSGSNPDVTNTLYVTLIESNGALDNSTGGAASAGHSICVIQDNNGYEVLSYTSAILVSPFTYALTGLYRGFYGTVPRTFAQGARFMFVGTNANFLAGNLPNAYIGKNFWIKPQSFNVFYRVLGDLSDVVAYEYLIGGPSAGSVFGVVDNVYSSDQFALSGQFFATLADGAVSSDIPSIASGLSVHLSDSTNALDHVLLPNTNVSLQDTMASNDAYVP